MEDLKLVARAVGLDLESPIEKVLDAISELQGKAAKAEMWEGEAEENLKKLLATDSLLAENASLKAEQFINQFVVDDRIDKAEVEPLKDLWLSGEAGEAGVRKLLAGKKQRDYFSRKSSLNTKPAPGDPVVEVKAKAAELRKADSNLSEGEALLKAKSSDPELAKRYDAAMVGGSN
jgi:hypothetical protein